MATLSLVLIVAFSKVRVLVLWLVAYLTLYAVNYREIVAIGRSYLCAGNIESVVYYFTIYRYIVQ